MTVTARKTGSTHKHEWFPYGNISATLFRRRNSNRYFQLFAAFMGKSLFFLSTMDSLFS